MRKNEQANSYASPDPEIYKNNGDSNCVTTKGNTADRESHQECRRETKRHKACNEPDEIELKKDMNESFVERSGWEANKMMQHGVVCVQELERKNRRANESFYF